MTEGAPLVLDLLNYIEQVEKLKSKPAFTVPTDYFVAYQHELKGLPELLFNLQVEGDDVWLRIPRLQEIAAPELDEKLKPWVTLPKNPDKVPELKTEVVIYDAKREVGREQLKNHPDVQELFSWYTENLWEPWAAAERPRRKSIARYNQLFSLQQAIASDGAETPLELVWGIGYAAWKKDGFATPLKYPLLVQACEILLNEKTLDLEIRPRDVEPRLEADCYSEMGLPGVRQLEAYWRSVLTTGTHRVNPFDASTFEGTLKAAVAHLDPTGAYEVRTDDVTPPTPTDTLKVLNTWVIFGRKRSGDIFIEDIRRLKRAVEEATGLPNVIRSLVEHGDSEIHVHPEQPFRGLSSSESVPGALELYFPMAYNEEQVSIVQKLHSNDGVVVQGPPGTGKTHTIANVICHYLAQGKRVLVTAKGESPLSVLQEKLPERIRPLTVALLSDERDGMKQFEHSIQTIASSVGAINPSRASANITAAEEKLNQLHAKLAYVDRNVADWAGKHMSHYPFQGREVTAEQLAQLVLENANEHQWFDDEPPIAMGAALPIDDAAVATLRNARMKVGDDLRFLRCALPVPDIFPPWAELVGLHRDLVKARAIDTQLTRGAVLALIDSQPHTFTRAEALSQFLEERLTLKARLLGTKHPGATALSSRFSEMHRDDPLLFALLGLCSDIRRLERQRRELLANAVQVPAGAEQNSDVVEAVSRLAAGKGAFPLPFGKSEARKIVAQTRVGGSAPRDAQEWELVQQVFSWRFEVRSVMARWSALSGEFGLESLGTDSETEFRTLVHGQSIVEDVRKLIFDFDKELQSRIEEVFGKEAADNVRSGGEAFVAEIATSLQAHLHRGRLAYATHRVEELLRKLKGCDGSVADELRLFLTRSLGDHSADESALQSEWLALQSTLARLSGLGSAFRDIDRVSEEIEAAGAPNWAQRARTCAATFHLDETVPVTWREAWHWRQAVMFLDGIDGHHKLRELFEERRVLTGALARTYQDLIAEKTWLGVFNNSPSSVRQALQAYLNAVQAMGAGTGIRAIRHRRTARDAMQRAYQAVPCWVLPHWRVSETLPAELGLFDLVVVDEASQSDIWALPALLRGKKILVVGDHKQVSPAAVGTAEEKINDLVHRFLSNQPHGSEMTPDKSIYDLARVVFAGNSVMLKEHFRCVPAIIEFSNREFYENEIRALRVPKANERLDPPLIDVFVKGGIRDGDINRPEAKAIVSEIEAILADSRFDGRSIGVVTLLGTAQAAHIHELVSERISPVDIVSRKIAIGPPPVFQGRERDIMLVSMVLSPGNRAAANRADMNQRFNVALSRARDRMYLFRSVGETEFREDSLNGRVLHHFKQPFRQELRKVQALREKCESGFEREMFDELVKRGFRVEPQVSCGGYRIDFVVEGNEGRRLAIECDGDRFHGPAQWRDDMARQRVLERAGWTFWRCFASSFVRRRKEVLDDLLQTLAALGIEAVGAESVDNTIWVHHKEVDPYHVDGDQPGATQ